MKHPNLPDFFTHVGRLDDIIVFLNGEKTNPVTFQNEVAQHPEIRAALLIGEQREEAALLLEPRSGSDLSAEDRKSLVERIWPTVEGCNTRCPQHARVSKDRVLVTSAAMPFLRAGKGTVQRQNTLALYKETIDALYRNRLSDDGVEPGGCLKTTCPTNGVAGVVRQIVKELTGNVLSDTTDFLSAGMDSAQIIRLQRALERELPQVPVTTRMIYSNPTIEAVTKLFASAATPDSGTPWHNDDVSSMIQSYRAEIQNIDNGSEAMLASMHGDRVGVLELDDIRTISAASSETVEQPLAEIATSQPDKAVLLTGSTGALGSYMLDALLEGGTRRVYCFNRSANSQSLQTARNQRRGLSSKFLDSHVTFLTGDLDLPYFGLPMSQFRDLKNSVTHVMHNAWPVDFNKPLQSYVKSLDGVVNLVRFCHHSPRQ
jgi:aryl carrier-like protein